MARGHSPRVEPVAALLLDYSPQLLQLRDHLLYDRHSEAESVVEEGAQGVLEAFLVQLAAPVLVLLTVDLGFGLVHLHAAETHPEGGRSAGGALGHLFGTFLRRGVVAVLARAHF